MWQSFEFWQLNCLWSLWRRHHHFCLTTPLSLLQNREGFYLQNTHYLNASAVDPAHNQGSTSFFKGKVVEAILGDAFLDFRLIVEVFNAQHCSIGLAVFEGCEEVELVAEFAWSILREVGEKKISCSEEGGRGRSQRRRNASLWSTQELASLLRFHFASVVIDLKLVPFLFVSREVNFSVDLAWIYYGCCHDRSADKHLCLDCLLLKGLLIVVELKVKWSIVRSFSFLLQVNGVQLFEKRVTSFDAGSAGL